MSGVVYGRTRSTGARDTTMGKVTTGQWRPGQWRAAVAGDAGVLWCIGRHVWVWSTATICHWHPSIATTAMPASTAAILFQALHAKMGPIEPLRAVSAR